MVIARRPLEKYDKLLLRMPPQQFDSVESQMPAHFLQSSRPVCHFDQPAS